MQIELNRVSKVIKRNTVIDQISLRLESGNVTGIKGVNGSGKTMLMRLIAGLIKPTAGEVVIDGQQLWKDISFPKSIGLLIENPAFLDSYSGFDNLKILASINDVIGDDRIKEVLSAVGLETAGRKKYKAYSLGMKQRLGIAAAIMESPDLILLDEPTNALDSDGVEMVKEIVRREKERGALVIVACHDETVINEMADDIIYLSDGVVTKTVHKRECTDEA
ncbi:MAG: ATP-binding cassette domain-containing protein [Ruminococcus sp.]|nr:ATP-binding cassette domain-containing protein [Ruminococcus sp.]